MWVWSTESVRYARTTLGMTLQAGICCWNTAVQGVIIKLTQHPHLTTRFSCVFLLHTMIKSFQKVFIITELNRHQAYVKIIFNSFTLGKKKRYFKKLKFHFKVNQLLYNFYRKADSLRCQYVWFFFSEHAATMQTYLGYLREVLQIRINNSYQML